MKPLPTSVPKPARTPRKPRKQIAKSTKPIAKKKRSPSEFQRIYGSRERVRFVQGLPCVVCGSGPSVNAHIETGGMGRKADANKIVPMCDYCHRVSHVNGDYLLDFWNTNLEAAARDTEAKWSQHLNEESAA